MLVGANFGHGKIKAIHADAVKAIPGVIDVITDYDSFIRNSQQGGETDNHNPLSPRLSAQQ